MPILTSESPIALEHLDDHLKAILKVKLREFVHLSPCFEAIPSIDVSKYVQQPMIRQVPDYFPTHSEPPCPNRQHRSGLRRRTLRAAAI